MMLSYASNSTATSAARLLSVNYKALAMAVKRLSSGYRINSAQDDAAAMAVSSLLRADTATLRQGSRNVADAISMLQSAESALGDIDEMMVRMKELATQASTDSYTDAQRTVMNTEYQQLAVEITRVSEATTYNGIALLDSTDTYSIHVGSSSTIDIDAQEMKASSIGLGTAGTKASYTNTHTAADSSAAGWATQSGGDDLVVRLAFTSGEDTDITFTSGTSYSMDDVASMINVASQATADAYNMASVTYDSDTNLYSLKLTNVSSGSGETVAITKVSGAAALSALTNLDDVGTDFSAIAGTNDVSLSSIETKTKATTALSTMTTAIATKDSYRGTLGAIMTRLTSAATTIDDQVGSLLAADSSIRDADIATEISNMTIAQIRAAAGISMLAQANLMPRMLLRLVS